MLNDVTKVRTMAQGGNNADHYDSGPNLAVLTLQKEDRVWVKHHYGQGYSGTPSIATFSGFLL